MERLTLVLDLLAIVSALVAAWLWFRASGRLIRRVSKHEVIDSTDLNRIVTAINRTQILNAQAALATAVSAVTVALRLGLNLFNGG
jgi:hypothetical protein